MMYAIFRSDGTLVQNPYSFVGNPIQAFRCNTPDHPHLLEVKKICEKIWLQHQFAVVPVLVFPDAPSQFWDDDNRWNAFARMNNWPERDYNLLTRRW